VPWALGLALLLFLWWAGPALWSWADGVPPQPPATMATSATAVTSGWSAARPTACTTSGRGVRLRAAPGSAGLVQTGLPDPTTVQLEGESQTVDGRRWERVVATVGGQPKAGWIASDLLSCVAGSQPVAPRMVRLDSSYRVAQWRSLLIVECPCITAALTY